MVILHCLITSSELPAIEHRGPWKCLHSGRNQDPLAETYCIVYRQDIGPDTTAPFSHLHPVSEPTCMYIHEVTPTALSPSTKAIERMILKPDRGAHGS